MVVPVFVIVQVWMKTVRGIMGVLLVIVAETNWAASPAKA